MHLTLTFNSKGNNDLSGSMNTNYHLLYYISCYTAISALPYLLYLFQGRNGLFQWDHEPTSEPVSVSMMSLKMMLIKWCGLHSYNMCCKTVQLNWTPVIDMDPYFWRRSSPDEDENLLKIGVASFKWSSRHSKSKINVRLHESCSDGTWYPDTFVRHLRMFFFFL